ncbi:hypothetical protein SLI_4900 [Streptomyces lividans 1326]|uniref:Uncharacterized protein n=1 Tax=Streptomyces lividans 1326 TaxID=1200984 RepID=A0A7U9HD99_STRLI|nr:hypothetical protein SLI_4900 [Streptomyces lividans 1326]
MSGRVSGPYRHTSAAAGPRGVLGRIRTSLATRRDPSGDQSGGEAPLRIRYCLRRCHGAPPKSGSTSSKPRRCARAAKGSRL